VVQVAAKGRAAPVQAPADQRIAAAVESIPAALLVAVVAEGKAQVFCTWEQTKISASTAFAGDSASANLNGALSTESAIF
jgi:hypothetical protein